MQKDSYIVYRSYENGAIVTLPCKMWNPFGWALKGVKAYLGTPLYIIRVKGK